MRRVVVTGVGVVSPLGKGREGFWESLVEGRCAIAPLEGENLQGCGVGTGAQIRDWNSREWFDRSEAEALDPFAQYLVVAGREAVADSGLDPEGPRTAVITGASMGMVSLDRLFHRLYREGKPRAHPLTVPRVMANAGASRLCREFGVTGPSFTLSTACSSSAHALGHAFWMVRTGQVEAALAGGSEAPFCPGNLRAWEALRVVDPNRCRPFSRDRQGMSLGEGAAVLVLECREAARRRAARIYAEVAGFGMSSDAHHLTRPLAEGAVAAMEAACRDAGWPLEEVDYINAHGTGTRANDATECRALRQVFGAHADRLMVSSTKSMHGHTLGAAGAMEAAATVLALHRGVVPPTASFTEPDPECDLDVVPREAREARLRRALSNSFAFGGLNAVLAFARGA